MRYWEIVGQLWELILVNYSFCYLQLGLFKSNVQIWPEIPINGLSVWDLWGLGKMILHVNKKMSECVYMTMLCVFYVK